MTRTREQILRERSQLRAEYQELFDDVARLLFREDPIGISFDNENRDEYEPETGTILPRLKTCTSDEDVLRVVYEEFVRRFGADTAGNREAYQQIARQIWCLWQERKIRTTDLQT